MCAGLLTSHPLCDVLSKVTSITAHSEVSSSQPTSGNWERTECSSANKLSSGHL